MVPLQYVRLFTILAVVQADLKNYNSLINGEKNGALNEKSIKSGSIDDDGLRNEQRSNLNDELNLVSDDRIPLDYDINEKSSEYKPKKTSPVLSNSLTNFASAVIKNVLFNQHNVHFDYKECIAAMANIIEEEELVYKITNLTTDAVQIVSKAAASIVHCKEEHVFSYCLTEAVNEVGAALIGVAEDIEHVLFAMLVVGEKLFQQIKLCFGRSNLLTADMIYALQHFIQFSDLAQQKKENVATNDVPKAEKEDDKIDAPKNTHFFKHNSWFRKYFKV